jgi:CRISPR-associated protein Csd1
MILQALKEYYDRKAADPESGIAPEGWEWKEIHVLIRINIDGTFVSFESLMDADFKAKRFLVPKGRYRAGSKAYAMPFLFWDHYGFVLGQPKSDSKKDSNLAERQRNHFSERIYAQGKIQNECEAIQAVAKFYKNKQYQEVLSSADWRAFFKTVPQNKSMNMSFALAGTQKLILDEVRIGTGTALNVVKGTCLVSGENAVLAELHFPISGVTQKPSPLVSINDKTGSTPFSSYGKTQCYNSPMSKNAVFKYTTALNHLLDPAKVPALRVGDMRIAYWGSGASWIESSFAFLFDAQEQIVDGVPIAIKVLYDSVKNGAYVQLDGKERFFVLGMAPNSGRIAIKCWFNDTVASIACHIVQHFNDLSIVESNIGKPHYFPLWRLLCNVAPQGESKNVPPHLAADSFEAILKGMPYPQNLLQAALRRTHAGIKRKTKGGEIVERVIPEIAAIIKAYLNRYHRIHPNQHHKEVTMALDSSQPSIGYQLGRLFATLEKIQEEANGKGTIREHYYGAASSSPVTVFSILMKLKNHHLKKLPNKGRVVNFEQLLAEIIGRFSKGNDGMYDFPAHIDLHEQGRFAIGYYHQRQDLFTKKT